LLLPRAHFLELTEKVTGKITMVLEKAEKKSEIIMKTSQL